MPRRSQPMTPKNRYRLLLAATLLFVAPSPCRAPEKPREVQLIASSTLADLTTGDATQACSRLYMNRPTGLRSGSPRTTRQLVGGGLPLRWKELGTLSDRAHHPQMAPLLRAADNWRGPSVLAGASETWARRLSKSPTPSTSPRLAQDILSFSFTHLSGKWELRSDLLRRRALGAKRPRKDGSDWPGIIQSTGSTDLRRATGSVRRTGDRPGAQLSGSIFFHHADKGEGQPMRYKEPRSSSSPAAAKESASAA